jgi:hypothetical protein
VLRDLGINSIGNERVLFTIDNRNMTSLLAGAYRLSDVHTTGTSNIALPLLPLRVVQQKGYRHSDPIPIFLQIPGVSI